MTINVLARACLILLVATALYATVGTSAAATSQTGANATGANAQKTNGAGSGFQAMYTPAQSTATSMIADTLVVRPLSLVATVAGTGLFILSLPVAILGNNVDAAAHTLVVEPARYTFKRPLGHFPHDSDVRHP